MFILVLTAKEFWVMQVLELESKNVKALYRRAQAYMNAADLDLAELDIKKALEIDPENRYALPLVKHALI